MEKYIKVTSGEHSGKILQVRAQSENNLFFDCIDFAGNRYRVSADSTIAATNDAIESFKDQLNNSSFILG